MGMTSVALMLVIASVVMLLVVVLCFGMVALKRAATAGR